MTPTTGQFIVLAGPDGCGKSTQTRLVSEWLAARGLEAAGNNPGVKRSCRREPTVESFPLLLKPQRRQKKYMPLWGLEWNIICTATEAYASGYSL